MGRSARFFLFQKMASPLPLSWVKGASSVGGPARQGKENVMSQTMRGLIIAAVVALGTLGGTGAVRACDPPCCEYKVVVYYETHYEPYTQTVTCYDECGRPYTKEVAVLQKVKVPVTKLVKVCY